MDKMEVNLSGLSELGTLEMGIWVEGTLSHGSAFLEKM